jgi:hypothetical protein
MHCILSCWVHAAHQGPWWMFGLGELFKGGDVTLDKPASTPGPLQPGSVEGIPRTFYDGYTADDGNMAKNEQGFYYLKEDKRAKINPFEKVRRWPLSSPARGCSACALAHAHADGAHSRTQYGRTAPHGT